MEYLPEIFSTARNPLFANPMRAFEDVVQSTFKPWLPMQRIPMSVIPLDVLEYKDRYVVKADLPGIDRKFVDIAFENSNLIIRIDQTKEEERKEVAFLVRERLVNSAVRSVILPLADPKSAIDATLKEGVLFITVPKQLEKHTKKIEIH